MIMRIVTRSSTVSSFNDLRRNAQQELERITKETERVSGGAYEKDARYWKPALDQAGNGSALIRFLPRPDGEDFPFVQRFSYGFKGPTGQWYIELSPQTIELQCPVNERWAALYSEGTEEAKERAKLFRRRINFISNILVIKHPARPDDEGKVFLYEYGKKIKDKLNDKMNPSFPDVQPFNPFDLDTGANFRLRIMKKDGFTNYDKSEFDVPAPLSTDDAIMEKVWRQCYSLKAEIALDKFKPYHTLRAKLDKVLGTAPQVAPLATEESPPWEAPAPAPARAAAAPAGAPDDLEWFRKMAQNS